MIWYLLHGMPKTLLCAWLQSRKKAWQMATFCATLYNPTRWYRKHNYSGHNLATAHAAYIML